MEDLGTKLQEERLRRGIELQDISNATHISASVLRDIENNNFEKYKGDEEYIKMYLRKYSEYLGVDARDYISDYITLTNGYKQEDLIVKEDKPNNPPKKQVKISNPKFAKSKKVYESEQTSNFIRYAIIVVLIIAIFGVVYFGISLMNNNSTSFSDNDNFNVTGEVTEKETEQEEEEKKDTDQEDTKDDTEEEKQTETTSGITVEHTAPYTYTVTVPSDEETFKVKFAFVTQTWCKLVVNGATYSGFQARIYNEANVNNDINADPEIVELEFNTNETYQLILTNGHNIGHSYYFDDVQVDLPSSEELDSNVDITFNIVKQ